MEDNDYESKKATTQSASLEDRIVGAVKLLTEALGVLEGGQDPSSLTRLRQELHALQALAARVSQLEGQARKSEQYAELLLRRDSEITRLAGKLEATRKDLAAARAASEKLGQFAVQASGSTDLVQKRDDEITRLAGKLEATRRDLADAKDETNRAVELVQQRDAEIARLLSKLEVGRIDASEARAAKQRIKSEAAQNVRILDERIANLNAKLSALRTVFDAHRQNEHIIAPILGAMLNLEGGSPHGATDEPPSGTEVRDFHGVKIAFPAVAPGLDFVVDSLRNSSHFPIKSAQIAMLACRNRPRGVMIDVGGNVGLTAIPPVMFDLVEKAILLEPSPLNCECLRWTIKRNGLDERVELHEVAVGDHTGRAKFALTDASSQHHLAGNHPYPTQRVVEARMVTLDDLASISSAACAPWSFVKIDTQGAEAKVLRGATRVLEARNTMFEIEFWPEGIRGLGDDPEEVLSLAENYFRWVVDGKLLAEGIRPISDLRQLASRLNQFSHTDFVLLP